MSGVGRNDPCPCGSGKKFKKCCLSAAASPSGVYTQAERQSALVALGRFGWRREFDGDRAVASARFWMALDLVPEDERAEVQEQGEAYFQDWFTTDFRLDGGRTLIDLFLERERGRLRSGELRYLERARATHLRLYEIVGVKPDEGLTLLDLWTGKRVQVQERLATRQVVQWDVLAARMMLGPAGVPVLDGLPYLYPARAKDALVKDLRGARRKFRRQVPGDDADFFKRFGRFFFVWWIEYVILAARLALRTAEGDEMVLARAVFDVRDRPALDRALAGHPDLSRQDDGSYAWHEPGGDDAFRRGLGAFVLDKGRVVFETTSKPRAERGRAFLEALAGEAVRHRATSFESVEQAMERQPAAPAREADAIPPAVQAQVVGAYYEQHYRAWVDTPLPALGGQAPREAARSRAGRPRVVALLKDMESLSARQRREGHPAYDFGWMWGELGLDRPG
ncbi:MAG: SEC-C metal-binding domain-containing protein [Candidatus Rokuibacteriota bacterium]